MDEVKKVAEGPALTRLSALVETLRGENGCPWDRKQTPRSMIIQLLEEAYELADAVEAGDARGVCEELGDVLFHIFFMARLFEEQHQFGVDQVADGIVCKMVRRHPHVFGEEALSTADEVKQKWHEIKQQERGGGEFRSVLASVPKMLPALMRAYRISERAGREGFDWGDLSGVMEKMEEEWGEFETALADSGPSSPEVRLEFGDLLFTMANVARFLGINPEAALLESTRKFEDRFRHMERTIKDGGRHMAGVSQAEKDVLWEQAKSLEVKRNLPSGT